MELSQRDITYCKNVGAKRADILRSELGVRTAMDMVRQYPYKYIDRSRFYRIAELDDEDTYVQIIGEVTEWHTIGIGKAQRLSATFFDGTHQCELVWFKGVQYVKLQRGVKYLLFGKPSRFQHVFNFVHPELTPWSKVTPEMTQGLEPYYNTTEKMKRANLNSKAVRSIIAELMPELKAGVPDTIGADVLQRYRLMSLTEALANVHFPRDTQYMQNARARLKFEELFYIQLQILRTMKRREQNPGYGMPAVGRRFHALYRSLPFPLTEAQKRVIREIHEDMKSGRQMNRLLQGDVGSGKTLVALLCCLLAVDNGYQACIMAPTEILANQHYETLKAFLAPLGDAVHVALLTGSTSAKNRAPIHDGLINGTIHILIGTHALLEDNVQWQNLGFVVIDEQHRFGVAQRAKLWTKSRRVAQDGDGYAMPGCPPHILVMTATPIPRTLAMTVYGDLQVSVIDELPPGRKPVQTVHYSLQRRAQVYSFVRKQIQEGRQVYVVFPLIKENEKLDLQDLQNGFNELCEAFPEYRISMVHGQMKASDKDLQMQRFASGETQILVATTVIEVGVNVPNATVMIIQNAERFGLSQLHQLRGRVGRGGDQSYCLLLTRNELTADTRKRMDIMVATNDGFRIAEADLQLRGPGDLEGTLQSGTPFDLHIANLATDSQLLTLARQAAMDILDQDPLLEDERNRIYKRQLDFLRISQSYNWGEIS
ncbi:MAG: ATP-dependent DNA helicase RecG [Paludibacteraceae bacterium]|nr:ATP-dependent DNA helicase RecG [Paludibacteraceae bacterium]MBQ6747927.1 ATP-dependent DNA helicase RecG [Paludibacteraceae bacterium]MBQ6763923.1 ATP-dependent DNA helicase RecG [Paludibacteraceae bacterium]